MMRGIIDGQTKTQKGFFVGGELIFSRWSIMKQRTVALLGVLSIGIAAVSSTAAVYNPEADFSSSNPNGVWSYGVANSTATTFTALSPYTANTDTPTSGV